MPRKSNKNPVYGDAALLAGWQRRLFFLPGEQFEYAEQEDAQLQPATNFVLILTLGRFEQHHLQTVHKEHEDHGDIQKIFHRFWKRMNDIEQQENPDAQHQ